MSWQEWLAEQATAREAAGLTRRLVARPPVEQLLDLASNDYLGLARDPRVVAAGVAALQEWGAGSTGSRLVTGTTELHRDLERALATFFHRESALVLSSGYAANLAAVVALADSDTLLVSDAGNHASLVDAVRLARAPRVVTPHNDLEAVDEALRNRTQERALVVSDSVFSVDGDLAPVTELHDVCRRHGALLLLDEAHAVGVLGTGGRGLGHALRNEPDVVITATLSKALGSQGGVVAGTRAVVEQVVNAGRAFVFDTALAPASAGAALEALRILAKTPVLVGALRRNAREIAAACYVAPPAGAVVSAVLGDPLRALEAQAVLAEHGVRVGCFRPPSVPEGTSRLRLTARADLTPADLAVLRRAVAAIST